MSLLFSVVIMIAGFIWLPWTLAAFAGTLAAYDFCEWRPQLGLPIVSLAFAGVLLATGCGKEPTLLRVCLQGDTVVYDASKCDLPFTITWPSLPLRVKIDPDLADGYKDSVVYATQFWKDQLDRPVFVLADDNEDISIGLGDARNPYTAATSHYFVGGKLKARVDVNKPGDLTAVYWIVAHEFGHVLGLAHDRVPGSIMIPEVDLAGDLEKDGPRIPMYVVTRSDKEAILSKY